MTGMCEPFFGFEICDLRTFFGFEICDLRTFFGFEILSDFFWVRHFGKDFFGG